MTAPRTPSLSRTPPASPAYSATASDPRPEVEVVSPGPEPIARSRGLPLERKLPLLILGVLTTALAVSLGLSYYEIRRSAELSAADRLSGLSRVLATTVEQQTNARSLAMRRVAHDTAVIAFLRNPARPSSITPAAQKALAFLTMTPNDAATPAQLWTAEGRPIGETTPAVRLETPGDIERPTVNASDPTGNLDSAHIGRFHFENGRPFYWITMPVRDADTVVGFVAQRRRVSANPRALQPFRDLIGSDIELYFRNANDSTWLDLTGHAFAAPIRRRPFHDGVEIVTHPQNGPALASSAVVSGTPFVITIEQPMGAVLSRPLSMVRVLFLIALLLAVLGGVIAWIISRRMTRPLAELTGAAEAIALGTYSRRVRAPATTKGGDEIGRLAAAFNHMASKVGQSAAAQLALRMEAEAASRAKSEFLARMSHEIRTPINAMMGYAELLELGISGPVTEAQSKQLARIRVSGDHLTALVDEILDIAKIEAGRLSLEPVVAIAGDAAEAALALIRPQAVSKGVDLDATIEGDPRVRYRGDPQRVQQILTNLLSNAVKFTQSGGRISVSCGSGDDTNADATGGWAYIAVRDTGVGIAESDIERIFQPFVQVNGGYTRTEGGTGLGLTISRNLAQLMGGDIIVESVVDEGSRFVLWLPSPDPDK